MSFVSLPTTPEMEERLIAAHKKLRQDMEKLLAKFEAEEAKKALPKLVGNRLQRRRAAAIFRKM